jgi:hypothetical protein
MSAFVSLAHTVPVAKAKQKKLIRRFKSYFLSTETNPTKTNIFATNQMAETSPSATQLPPTLLDY